MNLPLYSILLFYIIILYYYFILLFYIYIYIYIFFWQIDLLMDRRFFGMLGSCFNRNLKDEHCRRVCVCVCVCVVLIVFRYLESHPFIPPTVATLPPSHSLFSN